MSRVIGKLFGVLVVFIVTLIMGITSIIPYFKYQMGPSDFNNLLKNDFKNGMVIEGDLYFAYDCFAEEYTTENGVKRSGSGSQYYVIPVGEAEYMSVSVPPHMWTQMDSLCDDTYSYISYETEDIPNPVHLVGKIIKNDAEIEGFLYDWFKETEWFDSSENAADYVVPLTISIIDINNCLLTGLIFIGISLIFLIIAIISILRIRKLKLANKNQQIEYIQPDNSNQQHQYTPDYSKNNDDYNDNQKPPCEL